MNIPKRCRACLAKKEWFSYYLFENVSAETYRFCTSVQVSHNDKLPKTICDKCYERLNKFYEFKQTCIQSEKTLLNNCYHVKCESTSMINENVKYEDAIPHSYSPTLFEENELVNFEEIKPENLSDHNETEITLTDAQSTNKVKIPLHKGKKQKHPKCEIRTGRSTKGKPFLYTCEVCNRKFRHLERLEAHKLEHDGKKISVHCTPCNKTFKTWEGLSRHRESKHSAVRLGTVCCRTCGRVCASRHSLLQHQRLHAARASCVCHVCGKKVSTKLVLKTHLETHKADRERRHTCEHCGKKFFTNTMLLSHIARLHTGRRYICDYCQYPFTDKYNLMKHILSHNGRKLHTCDICHKSYGTNGSLVEHKRIHSGERPFGCSYCSKRFRSQKMLTDHHRTHTGEKPHKCNVCDQRFTQRGTLQRHKKIHDKGVPVQ